MSDVAKRVEAGKDDLIRKLMAAKAKRRAASKLPPPEAAPDVEAETSEAPADPNALTDEDTDELLRLYENAK